MYAALHACIPSVHMVGAIHRRIGTRPTCSAPRLFSTEDQMAGRLPAAQPPQNTQSRTASHPFGAAVIRRGSPHFAVGLAQHTRALGSRSAPSTTRLQALLRTD